MFDFNSLILRWKERDRQKKKKRTDSWTGIQERQASNFLFLFFHLRLDKLLSIERKITHNTLVFLASYNLHSIRTIIVVGIIATSTRLRLRMRCLIIFFFVCFFFFFFALKHAGEIKEAGLKEGLRISTTFATEE